MKQASVRKTYTILYGKLKGKLPMRLLGIDLKVHLEIIGMRQFKLN
jgi:hypothetical protein